MLVLVRHGQSTLNAEGRLAGHLDVDLTEEGERQAAAAASLLGPVVELRHSPLLRARRTAELLGTGAELVVEPRAIEVDYGELDGTPLAEVDAETWQRLAEDPTAAPPGGESLSALQQRVDALMEEVFSARGSGARSREGDLVIVSHVSPIKAAAIWALGLEPLAAWRLRLSTASVTRIDLGPRGPQLVGFNELPSGR